MNLSSRFSFPWQHKHTNVKKGKKSSLFQTVQRNNDDDDIGNSDDLLLSPTASPDREVKGVSSIKPRRRTGGWGEEIPKSGKKRGSVFELEDERLKPVEYDSDNDMPLIPDLDDVQDEDLSQQVAEAPHVLMNRVATYKELDNDLLKHAAFATFDDIDLRILMKNLSPEAEINEPDEPWIWDVLYTEVTSEINSEKEMDEKSLEEPRTHTTSE
uniref:Intraflagellar transport protein 43 homolog n=1 Tax=Strigamia maritima TaxID=126957 RepID=T1JGE3_STRMM